MSVANITLFAQSNFFKGKTEDGLKRYKSKDARIHYKMNSLQPKLSAPNSEFENRKMKTLQFQFKDSIPPTPLLETKNTLVDESSVEGIITSTFIKNIQKYRELDSFHDSLACVSRDGKDGYINLKGEEVIPCKYQSVRSFSEGMAAVQKDRKWGFINTNGEEVVPCIYDYSYSFSGGMAAVEKKGKWGIINTNGEEVVPCIYDYSYSLSGGMAAVSKNGKLVLFNTKVKELVPYTYDNSHSFSEGMAAVEKNEKWGFININGEEVVPCKYQSVLSFSEGMAAVEKNGKWGFINTNGEEVIPCIYDNSHSFSGGMAIVMKNEKYGYVDAKGNLAIPCKYDGAKDFSEGLAAVRNTTYFNGAEVISVIDDYVDWGFIDEKGKVVIPFKYSLPNDERALFSEGVVIVQKSELFGYVNREGKQITLCKYTQAQPFSNGYAFIELEKILGEQGNKQRRAIYKGYVDKNGKEALVQCGVKEGTIFYEDGMKYVDFSSH